MTPAENLHQLTKRDKRCYFLMPVVRGALKFLSSSSSFSFFFLTIPYTSHCVVFFIKTYLMSLFTPVSFLFQIILSVCELVFFVRVIVPQAIEFPQCNVLVAVEFLHKAA